MKSFPSFAVKKPAIAEMDVSGIVVSQGEQVKSFKVGDEVFGIIPGDIEMKTGIGALAQYTVVEEIHLSHKPQNISWQEAAAIPLVSLTAYDGLAEIGGLKSGQRVFINGGSGGVGSVGIQIAKALGAYVVTSCSDKNIEFVKGLGADEAVDYKSVDLPAYLKDKYSDDKFHVILDTIGSDPLYRQCEPYVDEHGIFVQVGAPASGLLEAAKTGLNVAANMFWPSFFGGTNRRYKFMLTNATRARMDALTKLATEGKLRPPIDSEYPFSDVLKAYEKIMSLRARGKVVVNVSSPN